MLVNAKKILEKAKIGRYAVPAFNINNLEFLQAVIGTAEKLKSPVILQTSAGAINYAGMDYLLVIMKLAAKKARVPVAIHLDHGTDYDLVKKAIKAGYSSVMYDGSRLPYAENIRRTRTLAKLAHRRGVTLEAELGAIAGKEDLLSVTRRQAQLTDPVQAADFVQRTGCDSLAVSIGTLHGAYKFTGKTKLDYRRLSAIAKLVKVPLVLHGASGVNERLVKEAEKFGARLGHAKGVGDSAIKKAIKLGISKVNIDSDLRLAWLVGLRQVLKKNPKILDPRQILGPAKKEVAKTVVGKIRLFGSGRKG